jgi:hypothetical protein
MNQYFNKIPDELFGLERTDGRPPLARVRFTPTQESAAFLSECQKLGYDLSTIINLALITFKPKTKPNGFTWEGIDSVL